MRFFRVLRDRRGIGLIQILVGAFVASIISLGVAQMMQQARISQRRIGLMTTLAELQKRINSMILDQSSFNSTINRGTAAPFLALQTGTAQAAGGPNKIVLYDAASDLSNQLDLLGPATMTGNGFTEKGTPCTTFDANPGSGNDDCPISYRLMISWSCPASSPVTCVDPLLVVVARLVFNPSTAPNRTLQKFKNLIQQGPANTTSPAMKFDVVVKRTASSIAREFKLVAFMPAAGGATCPTSNASGGGQCTVGAFGVHPLTTAGAGWTVDYDPNGLVNANAAGAGNFRLNEIGFYACSLKAYAYMTNVAQLALFKDGVNQGAASTYAGVGVGLGASGGTEALLRLDVSVNVTATTETFTVRQQCAQMATPNNCSLGFSKNTADALFPGVSIVCSKLDAAF